MRRRNRWSLVGVAMAWGAVTFASTASAEVVWAKTGTAAAAMQDDYRDCIGESRLINVEINIDRTSIRAPGGVIIGSWVGAGVSAALKPTARAEYINGCMVGRGYTAIPLSSDEDTAFAALKAPDTRSTWLSTFYSGADFDRRLTAATPPPVKAPMQTPPLPPTEPFTFGAARFDPIQLTLATGELGGDKAIFTGPLTHRSTGRITLAKGFHGWRVEQGLIVQKAIVSGSQGNNQTFWCGQIVKSSPDSFKDYCLWIGTKGVVIYPGRDVPWLDRPLYSTGPAPQFFARLEVTESPDDLIGPMTFGLYAREVSVDHVRVVAEAKMNGVDVDFWSANLPFDSGGKAVLPFWSYRLTLTKSGSGVVASLTKDGDGLGWEAVTDDSER